jgi:hypothetical protein
MCAAGGQSRSNSCPRLLRYAARCMAWRNTSSISPTNSFLMCRRSILSCRDSWLHGTLTSVVHALHLQVLILGWPLFSRVPGFRKVRQLHRFAWLATSLALLVWHAVVFKVLLQQPNKPWIGRLDLETCSLQAVVRVRGGGRITAHVSRCCCACMLLAGSGIGGSGLSATR